MVWPLWSSPKETSYRGVEGRFSCSSSAVTPMRWGVSMSFPINHGYLALYPELVHTRAILLKNTFYYVLASVSLRGRRECPWIAVVALLSAGLLCRYEMPPSWFWVELASNEQSTLLDTSQERGWKPRIALYFVELSLSGVSLHSANVLSLW